MSYWHDIFYSIILCNICEDFNEPRIHAALVCAAMSCPPLRNEPYLAEKLDQQLDDQVNDFIANNQGLKIDRQNNKVHLSSIFKWYGKDWIDSYGIENKFRQFIGASKIQIYSFLLVLKSIKSKIRDIRFY